MLAKRMGDRWSTPGIEDDVISGLDEFFNNHFACELTGDPYSFELYQESGPMVYRPDLEPSLERA
jgi:hypothetical protein